MDWYFLLCFTYDFLVYEFSVFSFLSFALFQIVFCDYGNSQWWIKFSTIFWFPELFKYLGWKYPNHKDIGYILIRI